MIENFSGFINSFAAQSLSDPLLAYPLYLLAGLVASLFPCVYPLYPISAGFLRRRSQDLSLPSPIWKQPFLYWCGMVLAYAILGLLATLSGGAFNQWMQNGFVIVGIGFLFLFLSFVSMDWISLSWEQGSKWSAYLSQRQGSFFTICMGAVAGLVASTCAAPVLVAVLLLVAQQAAGLDIAAILYGTSLCLSFGAGIALPFFCIGVLGARLPRSGPWMLFVKYGFAIAIALAAFYQIDTGLRVLAWDSKQIKALFAAMILLFGATLLGLRPPAWPDKKAISKFYFALLSLLFALGFAIQAFSNMASPSIASKPPQAYEELGPLRFYRDAKEAFSAAARERRPLFIDFYADWCPNCKAFTKLMQKHKGLQEALQGAVLLKIYDTDPAFQQMENDPRFPELKIGLPFFAILESNGKLFWKTTDYKDTSGMIQALSTLQKKP